MKMEKRARIAIFISERIEVKSKSITRDKNVII